jgi:hypothetical protein
MSLDVKSTEAVGKRKADDMDVESTEDDAKSTEAVGKGKADDMVDDDDFSGMPIVSGNSVTAAKKADAAYLKAQDEFNYRNGVSKTLDTVSRVLHSGNHREEMQSIKTIQDVCNALGCNALGNIFTGGTLDELCKKTFGVTFSLYEFDHTIGTQTGILTNEVEAVLGKALCALVKTFAKNINQRDAKSFDPLQDKRGLKKLRWTPCALPTIRLTRYSRPSS